jgi:hypothetical protein
MEINFYSAKIFNEERKLNQKSFDLSSSGKILIVLVLKKIFCTKIRNLIISQFNGVYKKRTLDKNKKLLLVLIRLRGKIS